MNKIILTGRKGYGKSLLMRIYQDKIINNEIKLNKEMYKCWQSELLKEPTYIN